MMVKKEKVLITGGAGYLGSIFTGHLLNEGYQVTCLDNLMYKQNSLIIYASNPDFDFISGDVRNEGLLKKIVPNFDAIIPLAAIVGMPACDEKPHEARSINYDAIVLINNLRSNNQKLIFPVTNSGYGAKTGEVFCTEETSLDPISIYGRTKVEAEEYVLKNEKDAISLRLATVFGTSPRMRTDLLVNFFTLKALKEGYIVIYEKDFKRNYVHIKDVARAFEHALKNYDSMKNNAYNLGLEGINLSKEELALKVKEHRPNFEIIFGEIGVDPDKRNYIVSNKKIMDTGFRTKYSLDEGIKELLKGYSILLRNDPYKNI